MKTKHCHVLAAQNLRFSQHEDKEDKDSKCVRSVVESSLPTLAEGIDGGDFLSPFPKKPSLHHHLSHPLPLPVSHCDPRKAPRDTTEHGLNMSHPVHYMGSASAQ